MATESISVHLTECVNDTFMPGFHVPIHFFWALLMHQNMHRLTHISLLFRRC